MATAETSVVFHNPSLDTSLNLSVNFPDEMLGMGI